MNLNPNLTYIQYLQQSSDFITSLRPDVLEVLPVMHLCLSVPARTEQQRGLSVSRGGCRGTDVLGLGGRGVHQSLAL